MEEKESLVEIVKCTWHTLVNYIRLELIYYSQFADLNTAKGWRKEKRTNRIDCNNVEHNGITISLDKEKTTTIRRENNFEESVTFLCTQLNKDNIVIENYERKSYKHTTGYSSRHEELTWKDYLDLDEWRDEEMIHKA